MEPSRRALLVLYTGNFGGSTISGHLTARGLRDAGWKVSIAIGTDGPYAKRLASEEFDVTTCPHRIWFRRTGLLRWGKELIGHAAAVHRFLRLIRRIRPDVVYVNSLASLSAAFAARLAHVPCVLHIRELFDDVGGEMSYPIVGGRRSTRLLLKKLPDQIIAISEAVRANCLGEEHGISAQVVSNAVADEYFDFDDTAMNCRHRLNLPAEGILIGVPGTLRPMKGHPFFLDTARRVVDRRPDVRFLITGDGTSAYREQLIDQAAKLGLNESVRFIGTVSDMRTFYRACDLVCIPSRAEPFGRVMIEAFALGVPIVATAVGGMRETIESGSTGILVRYGDVEEMASAIVTLVETPALRVALATRARGRAQLEYRSAVYQERIARIVARATASRAGARP